MTHSGASVDALAEARRPKRWQHRTRSPEETCRWLEGLRDRTGITRVADITGLDRVHIPVFQAVRPLGRSLTVSQGKGSSAMAARVSAIMESVEIWHAEHEHLPRIRSSLRALDGTQRIDPNLLCRRGQTGISPYVPLGWVRAFDLAEGGEILVPGDAANLDFTRPADPPELGRSTTGLAGGNTREEARASALAEVIERCCHREFLALGPAERAARRLDPDLLGHADPGNASLVERIAAAGLHLDLFDITNRFEVTAVRALLYGTSSGQPVAFPAVGHGAHLCPVTAAQRAITEAAQARLSCIAGNRDDIRPSHYRGADLSNWLLALHKGMDLAGQRCGLDRPDDSTDSPQGDAELMIRRILEKGAGPLVEIDLTRPDLGVPVVKIVAPAVAYLRVK